MRYFLLPALTKASLAGRIRADGIQGWSCSARAAGWRRFHLSECQQSIGDKNIDHGEVRAAGIHARRQLDARTGHGPAGSRPVRTYADRAAERLDDQLVLSRDHV